MDGPFLSMPTLTHTWPQLDTLDKQEAVRLRLAHRTWQADPVGSHQMWIDHLLRSLLSWGDALDDTPASLSALTHQVPGQDETITASFALRHPGTASPALLGLTLPPDTHPTARLPGSTWTASPADRLALLCRHHDVGLGLVAAGRWWTLVWAPRTGPSSFVTFDTADWTAVADRPVVRAFRSLLCRRRFFAVPEDETLPALLAGSEDVREATTDSLGQQVQRAVELLVASIGRTDVAARAAGRPGLADRPATEVYRAALSTQMRILFALFAEQKGLLPADNPLYQQSYSASGLYAELEARARDTSEEDLEQSTAAWHRLVALFHAIYYGVDHPDLRICGYDGSLFDPARHPWLEPGEGHAPWPVDDRTVLHMLASVQYVTTGRGRARERRRTLFGSLGASDIGRVYEGLLEYEGQRAVSAVVGLAGKEGQEVQVELAELERFAAESSRTKKPVPMLAAALASAYKKSGIGAATKVARALQPLEDTERTEAERKLLAATGGDADLTTRLLPFYRLVRYDLRGLPVVILPGGLYVGRSSQRQSTGAHYTPDFLAEEIVCGALEPLVHSPGPLDTADRDAWRPKSSDEILALKVADIACGSGALLVAACRYLAEQLVTARAIECRADAEYRLREEYATEVIHPHEPFRERGDKGFDLVMIRARREVAERCLYGVDINPLAVELAKFALWLETVEPNMPFTFLDDRLIAGDSLLGVSSHAQVESMHIAPKVEQTVHRRSSVDFTATLPQQIGLGANTKRAADLRHSIIEIPGISLAALQEKRRVLRDAEAEVELLCLFGDLISHASLAEARHGARGLDRAAVSAADFPRLLGSSPAETHATFKERAHERITEWQRQANLEGTEGCGPIHWPYRFPEVFQRGGFDAVVNNPPYLGGGKLTRSLGVSYREYLVNVLGREVRGNADLSAYFLLRAHELLNEHGQTGVIATNTLAQGVTREVGLDQLVADGVTIRQSVKGKPWPSQSAALEYCAVWTSRAEVAAGGMRFADGEPAKGITTSLDVESRATGMAQRLKENGGVSFQGSIILGLGFTITPEAAQELIAKEERYKEVLFPYLNGQDLNSRPDRTASRWVINFHDWSEERAKEYPAAYEQVRRLVKPERDKNNRKVYRDYWWQYGEKRPAMLREVAGLEKVLVITRVSKVVMPVMVSTGQVMSESTVVFATDDTAVLALLSSAPHYWWAIERSSTLETRIRYTPSDVFETFPRMDPTEELRHLGDRLDILRHEVMLHRGGLTATYNLVHDATCTAPDITELREIHRAIDEEVARAYGWHDLLTQPGGLDHGFHDTRQGPRYTVGPLIRQEILDRLLEENQRRYAAEQSASPAGVQAELPTQPTDTPPLTRTPTAARPASTPSPPHPTYAPDTGPAR
ncbi:Eco57I restriction-modification methylase domain-containing protein [Streptomyces sp. NPDC021093]|uniref:Eco57I restriction-modification methylase domain-containing protein n=1 Tax=Streptomyces sp. NPDC021093 TaxID=3365112 RepID=UPI00379BF317